MEKKEFIFCNDPVCESTQCADALETALARVEQLETAIIKHCAESKYSHNESLALQSNLTERILAERHKPTFREGISRRTIRY